MARNPFQKQPVNGAKGKPPAKAVATKPPTQATPQPPAAPPSAAGIAQQILGPRSVRQGGY